MRGVAVVQERAMLESGGRAVDLTVSCTARSSKRPRPRRKKSQLWIRPEAAMFDPLAKKFVLARDPDAGEFLRLPFTPIQSSNSAWAPCSHEGMSIGLAAQGIHSFQALERVCKRLLQAFVQFLVRIQTQNPVAGGFLDGRVFLRGVAFPLLRRILLRRKTSQSPPCGLSSLNPRR